MTHEYPFRIRHFGRQDYFLIWQAMQAFTRTRTTNTLDEIWLVEHNPVYTLGQRAIFADIIEKNDIPIVLTDRGGRVTYHGPGQLVIYPLLNLKRLQYHLRTLVTALENTVIQLLLDYQVSAYADKKAPGVYIEGAKVASLGLRIHKNCSYHGLAINVDMDLRPFQAIYPCGLQEMHVTHLIDWIQPISLEAVSEKFLHYWQQQSFYTALQSPKAL